MADQARRSTSPAFVDWRAALAGGLMAVAIAFVLLTFGGAIGLSSTSPWQSSGLSTNTVAALAVFWAMAVQIGAVLAGGYIAGRMREGHGDADRDEVEFRDGVHGGLTWAIGLILSAWVVTATAGAALKTAGEAAGRTASAAADSDVIGYYVGTLLRPAQGKPAGEISPDVRNELAGILTRSLTTGSLPPDDRTYLTDVVAQRSGLPREEAEKRIQATYNEVSRITKEAADKARRSGVLVGFVTAVSLIVSLAAGWWAAIRGGHHRDNSIPARFSFAQRREP